MISRSLGRCAFFVASLAGCSSSCGKGNEAENPGASLAAAPLVPAEDAAPRPLATEDLWSRAEGGESDDLARLASREGPYGLVERAGDPVRRKTALAALAFTSTFDGLPFLADVGSGANEKEAILALESAAALAASRRDSSDPEDAPDVRLGCDRLLAVARDDGKPKAVRILAIRTLRMLEDRRHAVDASAIPADLDAR